MRLLLEFGIHPNQVSTWKREAVQNLPLLFDKKNRPKSSKIEKEKEHLYSQPGRLKVEVDFLKKISQPGSEHLNEKVPYLQINR